MHPVTATRRNWIRCFYLEGKRIELSSRPHSITEISTAFCSRGFKLLTLSEPSFGEPERFLFEEANKAEEFRALQADPAIYLMKFVKTGMDPARD